MNQMRSHACYIEREYLQVAGHDIVVGYMDAGESILAVVAAAAELVVAEIVNELMMIHCLEEEVPQEEHMDRMGLDLDIGEEVAIRSVATAEVKVVTEEVS